MVDRAGKEGEEKVRQRETEIERLRAQLKWVRARYDDGAMSPAAYAAIKQLEADIAWSEHKRRSDYAAR
jgi:hypothetical protein